MTPWWCVCMGAAFTVAAITWAYLLHADKNQQ